MSKKRLGGRRPHWPNHGKSCVIFPFFPIHAKARTCGSDPRNKLGGAILTSYIGAVCGNRISRHYSMNGGYFRASKLRQAL